MDAVGEIVAGYQPGKTRQYADDMWGGLWSVFLEEKKDFAKVIKYSLFSKMSKTKSFFLKLAEKWGYMGLCEWIMGGGICFFLCPSPRKNIFGWEGKKSLHMEKTLGYVPGSQELLLHYNLY